MYIYTASGFLHNRGSLRLASNYVPEQTLGWLRFSEHEFSALSSSVIMVVGAGRGPLVDASLRAAYSANRRVMIYAVEKNPGAVITYVHRCLPVAWST